MSRTGTPRTSHTHPLRIAAISTGPGLGHVGITFCPGKHDDYAATGPWRRDLGVDLDAIRDWGAAAVVTLVESHELTSLRVERLGDETVRRGMRWFHLPIVDVSVPDAAFEARWHVDGAELLELLRAGRRVLVHCRGGLGRAGTIGARLLVELGVAPDDAIRRVRAARPGAIETAAQERYVRELDRPTSPQMAATLTLRDRAYGCLIGGACGDALGAPVEFLTREDILTRHGADGITAFAPAYGGVGLVTDDTQMTLFTVEGLIRGYVRGVLRGISHVPSVVHHAYLRWLWTQDHAFGSVPSPGGETLDGWLIEEPRLWARRAPGNTCLSALREAAEQRAFGSHADNNSKGCGTVMRDAPFGLGGVDDPGRGVDWAIESAWTTHGHPSARYSSGALAMIVAHVCRGDALPVAVERALSWLPRKADTTEVRSAVKRAVALSQAPDWQPRVPELGEGWVAEEALAIAVLCALAAPTPRDAIVAAVNHSGDSDSTGAITGNLVGAVHGARALPREWTQHVELRDVVAVLASDLVDVIEGRYGSEELAEHLSERYPAW